MWIAELGTPTSMPETPISLAYKDLLNHSLDAVRVAVDVLVGKRQKFNVLPLREYVRGSD